MEAQTSHRNFTVASLAVAFIGIIALGVAGVSTFVGAGEVNEHPGCQAGETEYQHLEGSGSNADISWSFDGTTATVTALKDSPLIMQIAIKSGGGPTVDDGLFTYRPGGTASATEQSTSTAPGNEEENQDVSFIDVCVGAPPAPTTTTEQETTTTTEQATTTTAAVGGIVEETTTTEAEVAGVVVEPETPRAAPEELAFTGIGNSTALFAALGVVLISFGIGLAWAGRRETALVHSER